jgi:hypothetical protein
VPQEFLRGDQRIIPRGAVMITRVLVAFTLCVLISISHATLVVFQWTPTEILLAADSLSAKVGVENVKGAIECKIHQVGNVFFTIVGVNDDPAIKVDLVRIANEAARTKGGIAEKMSRFEILAKPQIEAIMRREVTHRLGFRDPERISVILVDRKSHALIIKEYVEGANGSTSSLPRTLYSVPGKTIEPVAVGVYEQADAALGKSPAWSRLEGVPFIVGFMQTQIDHETYRLRTQHMIPRVGGKICVLSIKDGVASWVPGYQQQCPAIKPQYTQKHKKKS